MPAPLLAPLITGIIEGVSGAAVFSAVNNYLGSSPLGSAPAIPLSKKKGVKPSPKVAKKEGLAKYSDVVNAGLAGVIGAVMAGSSSMSDSAETLSTTNKAEIDALKTLNPDSPLLQNQLHLKQSVSDIVDAINSSTIASATFLAPITANLSAISSTLIAISSTLLEISDNYAQSLESAEDLPYIDTETFYDLLEKQGYTPQQIENLKSGEKELISSKSESGSTYPEIKDFIGEYRKHSIGSADLLAIGTDIAGVTSKSDGTSLESWAKSAKKLTDFKIMPRVTPDLDGNPLSNTLSPMELEAIKNASDARHKTDTNNEEFDESMFPSLSLPVLPFVGSSDIFNPNHNAPSNNPFSHYEL